jgi:hypothetical protein
VLEVVIVIKMVMVVQEPFRSRCAHPAVPVAGAPVVLIKVLVGVVVDDNCEKMCAHTKSANEWGGVKMVDCCTSGCLGRSGNKAL